MNFVLSLQNIKYPCDNIYENNNHGYVKDKKIYIVSLDGAIACGKTTLLNILEKEIDIKDTKITILEEPLNIWKDIGIFDAFYNDMKKYGAVFQMVTFMTRCEKLESVIKKCEKEKSKNHIIVCERSIYSDRVFKNLLRKSDMIDDVNDAIYNYWWRFVGNMNSKPRNLDGILYLDPGLSQCMNRWKERDRDGENISENYQNKLLEEYELFLKAFEEKGSKILRITELGDYRKENSESRKNIKEQIENFCKNLID